MSRIDSNAVIKTKLVQYVAERDALLHVIVGNMERDPRVVAAWLFGSLGRGTADDLSDIDIFVVVEDRHLEEVISGRHEMIAQAGAPVLVLEAPQNAPPGGAYNMALYLGMDGPHQVDWYWQSRSTAAIPQQTRLLFDHAGLPKLDTPPHFDYQPVPEREPIDAITQTSNFFWVMLLITAKYIARSPHEAEMGLAEYARVALKEVCDFLGETSSPGAESDGKPSEPGTKLAILRSLADRMVRAMPQLARMGGRPSWEVVDPARRYLDLIEALVSGEMAE